VTGNDSLKLRLHWRSLQQSCWRKRKQLWPKLFLTWLISSSTTFRVNSLLRFVHTRDLDLAILQSDAISIEILPSFQIATAGDSDNV